MVVHPKIHELVLRVRYAETDQMGFVHHSHYPVYFEMGRTEMLRSTGLDYRSVEESGFLLVIAKLSCRFLSPARYDDELLLRTHLKRVTYVRIEHRYELFRGDDLLCDGETTLACVDRAGNLQKLPPELGPTSD
ncbi:acyl-CoA thioesterase [bacterium]|jgi:acyl-CoA thioester hydrolase|nr:acyl-CoA thioesterase [bacterium]